MPDRRFYFTYGTNQSQPFKGGWTVVFAKTRKEAIKTFRRWHPDVTPGYINCARIYSEDEFRGTKMALKCKNFGNGCWEVIQSSGSDDDDIMDDDREGLIIAGAVETFGEDKQIIVAIEELSELIKSLTKYIRYGDNTAVLESISEEMADVEIMLLQLKHIFGDPEEVKSEKLERLEKLIENALTLPGEVKNVD